ncbi:patatin-like phospholipase family protein [Bradyrhizobium sp.]|uniref:patatin-like phospholipase family protein n=1 Tax=Bradyrhizobium sp. TaxID=376 RepID=UPI003C363B38
MLTLRSLSCKPALLVVLLGVAASTSGCAAIASRNALPAAQANRIELDGFRNIRFWGDGSPAELRAFMNAPSDAPEMHRPLATTLAISGGADDGAFAAGLLVGWSDSGTRPAFDLVTGISSGALIAPFAFIGSSRDAELRDLFTKYGRKDIFAYNVPSLLQGSALVDDSPLAKLIATYVDANLLQEIARERRKGRILLIGTTNLDAQRPVIWDMGRIAMSNDPEALPLFRKILLASATLPGIFAPVRIQVRVGDRDYDELHVDGGVTRQVFVAPTIVSARADHRRSDILAKPRIYVIRNGRIDPEFQPVNDNLVAITQRSISTLIKNQSVGDLYRIYSIARQDGIDFNLASIPQDFSATSDQPFDLQYMNALYDRAYDLAVHNYHWAKAPPGLETALRASN